jgi:hypothetical protein
MEASNSGSAIAKDTTIGKNALSLQKTMGDGIPGLGIPENSELGSPRPAGSPEPSSNPDVQKNSYTPESHEATPDPGLPPIKDRPSKLALDPSARYANELERLKELLKLPTACHELVLTCFLQQLQPVEGDESKQLWSSLLCLFEPRQHCDICSQLGTNFFSGQHDIECLQNLDESGEFELSLYKKKEREKKKRSIQQLRL